MSRILTLTIQIDIADGVAVNVGGPTNATEPRRAAMVSEVAQDTIPAPSEAHAASSEPPPWEGWQEPSKRAVPRDASGEWVCPVHGGSKLVPAGVSKRTGKAYAAFVACPERDCDMKPPSPEAPERTRPRSAGG